MYNINFDVNTSDAVRSVLSDEELLKFTFNIQFAKSVIEQRKRLGWTQEELSEKSGVNRVTIAKIEKFQRQAGIDVVLKLLNALNLDIRFVATDDV